MLTRRTLLATGAYASALPLLPSLGAFAQSSNRSAVAKQPAAAPYFSPPLADYLARSGAKLTQRTSKPSLNVKDLRTAARLINAAADHIEHTSLNAVVASAISFAPSAFTPKNLANALEQSVGAYQAYDPTAKITDLSYVHNLTDTQIVALTQYAKRVGVSGAFRDCATTFYRAAHQKRTLALRQMAFDPEHPPLVLDGLYYQSHLAHVHNVCSVKTAKEVLCSTGTAVVNDTAGLVLATLTVACLPAVLPEINAALPGIGIALDVACAALAVNPTLSIAAITGLATVLIGTMRDIIC